MLTKLSIQGFKSLQNVEDLELGVVNVFVGANGSGKSNLLEAVGLLSAAVDGQVDDQALLRRGVRISPRSLYNSSFKNLTASKEIIVSAIYTSPSQDVVEYQVDFDGVVSTAKQPWSHNEEIRVNGRKVEKFHTLYGGDEISFRIQDKITKPESVKLLGQLAKIMVIWQNYGIFSPNTPTLRGITPDVTQREPIGLAGGRLAEAIGELLDKKAKKLGDLELDDLFELLDWVDNIAIVPPSKELVPATIPTLREIVRFTDRWMSGQKNRLSAYDASEGALYVLFALVLALHPQSPRLFAIDNFDQAMHPRLARATTRLFCQEMLKADPARQVLLTTHNPLVLDGLDLRDDRIRLFAVERNTKGTTKIYRVQVSEEILEETQAGLSLSNSVGTGSPGRCTGPVLRHTGEYRHRCGRSFRPRCT